MKVHKSAQLLFSSGVLQRDAVIMQVEANRNQSKKLRKAKNEKELATANALQLSKAGTSAYGGFSSVSEECTTFMPATFDFIHR